MLRNAPSYCQVRAAAVNAFREALCQRGMNKFQAFVFAYENIDVLIDGPDSWSRILALTAIFKAGAEHEVTLEPDSPFTEDVLLVLRTCYSRELELELSHHTATFESEEVTRDVEYVKEKFLNLNG